MHTVYRLMHNLYLLLTKHFVINNCIIARARRLLLFLALANENYAHFIVSGDRHLLDYESYRDINVVTPSEATKIISTFLS